MRMGRQTVYQLALTTLLLSVLCACGGAHIRTATAATYYVATTGNDASPGTQAQPFQTIRKGLSVLRAGDTLYLRGGTYREGIQYAQQRIASGTSWSTAVTIASAPGETAILQPGSGTVLDLNAIDRTPLQYIIFDHLILDAAGASNGVFIGGSAQSIRLQNSEVKNARATGIQAAYGPTNLEFIKLHVHHNGSSSSNGVPMDHGFYVCVPNMVIRDSDVHDNWGYGLQVYATGQGQCNSGVSIVNNRVHDNGMGGATLDYGDNITFCGNRVYGNRGNGVDVFYSVHKAQVVHNTIYNNKGAGIEVAGGSKGAVIQNNIVYANGAAIQDGGQGTAMVANALQAGEGSAAQVSGVDVCPGFAPDAPAKPALPPVTNLRVLRVIP